MLVPINNLSRTKLRIILFASGVVVHLLLVRMIAHWEYPSPDDRTFVNDPLVNISLGFLGGLFYALALFPVLSNVPSENGRRFFLKLVAGGILGATATAAALQCFYFLCALFLAIRAHSVVPGGGFSTSLWLALIEIETYGLFVMFACLIPAFVSGMIVSAATFALARRSQRLLSRASPPPASGDPSEPR